MQHIQAVPNVVLDHVLFATCGIAEIRGLKRVYVLKRCQVELSEGFREFWLCSSSDTSADFQNGEWVANGRSPYVETGDFACAV